MSDHISYLAVQLYGVVQRELEGPREAGQVLPHSRTELVAWLNLAAAEINRLTSVVSQLRNQAGAALAPVLPGAVVVAVPAAKCRHEFPSVEPGKEGPGYVYRCVKCGAEKKANGRPKKEAAVVPAFMAPGGTGGA